MGFFDNLDDEASVDFLSRVESTQKGLQNLTQGERVVPVQATQGLDKEPVIDDEVDFFKEFALEDFEEIQQTSNAQLNVSSKTKTISGGLPSLDAELDLSDVTEISSKKDPPITTPRLQDSNTLSKESRIENQESCHEDKGPQKITEKDCNIAPLESPELYSIDQDGVLETIEEESGVEDTTQASEKIDRVSTVNASESKTGQEVHPQSHLKPIKSPEIVSNPVQQTPNHDQDREKISEIIPTQEKAESTPSPSNKKTSFETRRTSPLQKLTLLAPKKAQELFPLKRTRSRTKSPKPLLTKTSTTPIQASQNITTNATCQNLERDENTTLLPRKKQCTQKQQKSTSDTPTLNQEPTLPIPEPLTQQVTTKLDSKENTISMDLACNNEDSPVPVSSISEEESPELESPDFDSTTKELEFMMLDAKIVEDQLLESTVRLAIQANKLMRLDNPLIHQKLSKLNKEAEELLKRT